MKCRYTGLICKPLRNTFGWKVLNKCIIILTHWLGFLVRTSIASHCGPCPVFSYHPARTSSQLPNSSILNDTNFKITRQRHVLQFSFPYSSKKIRVPCCVYSGNHLAWVPLMIYVMLSNGSLENYLEDMNAKHFFSFSHQISIAMIYVLKRLYESGGRGVLFMVYFDPYGKYIFPTHLIKYTVHICKAHVNECQ